MSDSNNGSDLPYIPYTRLRELKHHAEMVVAAVASGGFTGSDLWRIYVGLEVNSLTATYWYEKFTELEEQVNNAQEKQAGDCGDCAGSEGQGDCQHS